MKKISKAFVLASFVFMFQLIPSEALADHCDDMEAGIVELEEYIQILVDSLGKEYVKLLLALGPPVDPIIVEHIHSIQAINDLIDVLNLEILILELGRLNNGCE